MLKRNGHLNINIVWGFNAIFVTSQNTNIFLLCFKQYINVWSDHMYTT